jgi:hypothetical protein
MTPVTVYSTPRSSRDLIAEHHQQRFRRQSLSAYERGSWFYPPPGVTRSDHFLGYVLGTLIGVALVVAAVYGGRPPAATSSVSTPPSQGGVRGPADASAGMRQPGRHFQRTAGARDGR